MSKAAFWDRHAAQYAKDPIKDMAAYEASLTRTRGLIKGAESVLEIGCGTGSTALLLAGDVTRYLGTDISPAMIEIARGKQTATPVEGLSFEVGDGIAGQHDAVLAFSLLHLVDDLDATCRAAFDAVKPGGLFISKTPCLGSKRWLFAPLIWVMKRLGKAPDVLLFTPAQLKSAVARAGFQVEEAAPYGSFYIVARRPG